MLSSKIRSWSVYNPKSNSGTDPVNRQESATTYMRLVSVPRTGGSVPKISLKLRKIPSSTVLSITKLVKWMGPSSPIGLCDRKNIWRVSLLPSPFSAMICLLVPFSELSHKLVRALRCLSVANRSARSLAFLGPIPLLFSLSKKREVFRCRDLKREDLLSESIWLSVIDRASHNLTLMPLQFLWPHSQDLDSTNSIVSRIATFVSDFQDLCIAQVKACKCLFVILGLLYSAKAIFGQKAIFVFHWQIAEIQHSQVLVSQQAVSQSNPWLWDWIARWEWEPEQLSSGLYHDAWQQ